MHGFRAGNYDNRLVDHKVQVFTNNQPVRYVGLGVLKPTGADRTIEGVTRARKARPLGMARLAIFKRPPSGSPVQDQDILYVSPRLLMHDTASMQNFYISRYYWSLRAIPGYQNLQAIWEISVPQVEFFDTMLDATRDVPLSRLWTRGAQSRWVMWITVNDLGLSRCLARYTSVSVDTDKDNMELTAGHHLYSAIKKRLGATPPGEDFVSPALAGTINPPAYFQRWVAGP
jgi:hypothetical protein